MESTHFGVPPRLLTIAGTDPSGGAGTAADNKSITAAGGYSMNVVTALVAQNTRGVNDIHVPPTKFLETQLRSVSDDVTIDGVKTGMLATVEIIDCVEAWLAQNPISVLVVDPVMIATSGDRLLNQTAEQRMAKFCEKATVITPNIDELAILTQSKPATSVTEAIEQAQGWTKQTGVSVVVKTGHLNETEVGNTWVYPDGSHFTVSAQRINTSSTHGTGCSLAAALTTRLSAGDTDEQALSWATSWLNEAIQHGESLRVGAGNGPIDHSYRSRSLQLAASSRPWFEDFSITDDAHSPSDLLPHTEVAIPIEPAVAPAGPWTNAMWVKSSELIRSVAQSSFVQGLISGSLPEASFSFYLAQDALYPADYSRALAGLAAKSQTPGGQVFWANGALSCLVVESEPHRSWLKQGALGTPGPVTAAYTNFLLATVLSKSTASGCAAVLPCYWLYAHTGATLPKVPANHPYASWLDTYRDPQFVTATQQALEQLEQEMSAASPAERGKAMMMFLTACRHEYEFFEQALRVDPGVIT